MKTLAIVGITLFSCIMTARGQDFKGDLFWVVETNANMQDQSLVKIYNGLNEVVHVTTINKRLDVTKRRHRKVIVQLIEQYAGRESVSRKKTKLKSSV